jgi:hypothetical protein
MDAGAGRVAREVASSIPRLVAGNNGRGGYPGRWATAPRVLYPSLVRLARGEREDCHDDRERHDQAGEDRQGRSASPSPTWAYYGCVICRPGHTRDAVWGVSADGREEGPPDGDGGRAPVEKQAESRGDYSVTVGPRSHYVRCLGWPRCKFASHRCGDNPKETEREPCPPCGGPVVALPRRLARSTAEAGS